MTDKILLEKDLKKNGGFLSGLGFSKNQGSLTPKQPKKPKKKKISPAIFPQDNQIKTRNSSKKKRKKSKGRWRFADNLITPQRGKNKGYNGYDVSNRVSRDDIEEERIKWKYLK